jgi:hypothetical protein
MSAGEYLQSIRESAIVLNNKGTLPKPADIPKHIIDPINVSKAVLWQ